MGYQLTKPFGAKVMTISRYSPLSYHFRFMPYYGQKSNKIDMLEKEALFGVDLDTFLLSTTVVI